jgi:hypothetical protein
MCLVIVMGEATPEEKMRARIRGLSKKQSILVLVVGGTMVLCTSPVWSSRKLVVRDGLPKNLIKNSLRIVIYAAKFIADSSLPATLAIELVELRLRNP